MEGNKTNKGHVKKWDTVVGRGDSSCWGPSEEPCRTGLSLGIVELSAIAARQLRKTEGSGMEYQQHLL